jgi:hypothetical protein
LSEEIEQSINLKISSATRPRSSKIQTKSGGADVAAYKINPIKSGQVDFRLELNLLDLEEDMLRN